MAQLVDRAKTVPVDRQPEIYIRAAEQQLKIVTQLYNEGKADDARAGLNDVVAYADYASDTATKSRKHVKNIEIELRKMAEKLRDLETHLEFRRPAPGANRDGPPGKPSDQPFGPYVRQGEEMKLAVCVSLLLLVAMSRNRRKTSRSPESNRNRPVARHGAGALERLKLYVEFARARLLALDKARSDPKVTDRGQETHDRLQDFLDVFDELNDNVDTFADRKEDLRKALKVVIEGDSEFQSKLRALKDAAEATPAETKAYDFLLTNAIETVDSSIEDHRQLLDAQEEAAKHKRKRNNPATDLTDLHG